MNQATNASRARHGVPPLKYSNVLSRQAQVCDYFDLLQFVLTCIVLFPAVRALVATFFGNMQIKPCKANRDFLAQFTRHLDGNNFNRTHQQDWADTMARDQEVGHADVHLRGEHTIGGTTYPNRTQIGQTVVRVDWNRYFGSFCVYMHLSVNGFDEKWLKCIQTFKPPQAYARHSNARGRHILTGAEVCTSL